MEKKLFNEYLERRYRDQMAYYDRAAMKNQKRYKQFQWLLIVLSAITPVIAALDLKWDSFRVPVVIVSSLVAILTTGMKTFQYQELWVSYRTTREQLKPEIYYYEFAVGPYAEAGVDKENLFVTRVEAILNKENTSWPVAKKINNEESPEEKEEQKS